jgi:hypothetical protein
MKVLGMQKTNLIISELGKLNEANATGEKQSTRS